MKKTVVAFLFGALLAILFVQFFRPDLLDRFQQANDEPEEVAVAAERPGKSTPLMPMPDPRPETREAEQPKISTASIRLDHIEGRSVYVNGIDRTGHDRCEVPPETWTVVATWKDGRYSHERLMPRAGEEVSPEALLKSGSPAPAWSGFQGGPARTGLADSSARDGFTVRWESRVEDQVQASPIIQGNTAYFASDTAFVGAVDLATGELLWSHGIVGGKVSPVAVGDFVFSGNSVGRFEGFRAGKGKLKGTAGLGSGLGSLALISDDLLLAATSGGMLLAIETRKNMVGRLPLKYNWEVTVPEFAGSTATPLILGDRAILQTSDGELMAVSLADGSMIWPAGKQTTRGAAAGPDPDADMTFRFVGTRNYLTPTPAEHEGVIYAAHRSRIKAVKADDGTLLWERGFDCDVASSVSLAWDTIYIGCTDGMLRAFSCREGVPIFSARLGETPVFASPVLFDGQLLAAGGEGTLFLLNAFSGTVIAEDDTLAGSPIDATPAVWKDGILAINRDGEMACFE